MDLKNLIEVNDAVLPWKSLGKLIEYINTKKFQKAEIIGETGKEVNMEIRNTWNLNLSIESESMSEVHWQNVLTKVFRDAFAHYTFIRSKDPTRFYIKQIIDTQILKYEEGGFYSWHVDHCAEIPRTISGIFLLNNDYKGGELCFRNSDKTDEWCIEVKPNRIIVWPSNFLFPHTVKPVKKGTRFSVVSWGL